MRPLRCAVYTRTSSSERLGQTFNSLEAQADACRAYILSQKGEGWQALDGAYEDGGWSGGSRDRPALNRLMADLKTRSIDVVVVYKIDRLTRSLHDFVQIVELFDRYDVSFVSVTQSFSTSSSMGRLTLNVLLSFAQFEREVTGERIRDKIAASKARGLWMGGTPPIGYDPDGRSLAVNPINASTVRHIYRRFLALRSVHSLAEELESQGIRSAVRKSASGKEVGGFVFSRGALLYILKNRVYLGEITHKGRCYPGQHEPIMEPELFDAVGSLLGENATGRREVTLSRARLTGLLFDAEGSRMAPQQCSNSYGRRYWYYSSVVGTEDTPSHSYVRRRVPAGPLDQLILDQLRAFASKPEWSWDPFRPSLQKIVLHKSVAIIFVSADAPWISGEPLDEVDASTSATVELAVPLNAIERGGETWLTCLEGGSGPASADRSLVSGLRRAHRELRERGMNMLGQRPIISREAGGVADPYLRKLVSLAFLAPDIQRAILEGRQPAHLCLDTLLSSEIPLPWPVQRAKFGFMKP